MSDSTASSSPPSFTPDDIVRLSLTVRGGVAAPGSPLYEQRLMTVFNAAFRSRQPAMFVLCHEDADVSAGLKFARDHGLEVCIKSGGHSACGSCVRDGALVLDLEGMHSVRYNPGPSSSDTTEEIHDTVTVEVGATLGSLNVALMRHGRITPVGIAPPTGVGGLALHGGVGTAMHRYGSTTDQIVALDIVLANGKVRHLSLKSEGEDRELFFAARGCAGSVGVVTRLTLRTYPDDMCVGGLWMLEDDEKLSKARTLMKRARDIVAEQESAGKRTFFGFVLTGFIPPEPHIPKEKYGKPCVMISLGNWGTGPESAAVVAPFAEAGALLVGKPPEPMPYSIFNQLMGAMFLNFPPFANYFAGEFADYDTLDADAVDTLLDGWAKLDPSVQFGSFTGLELHGGKAGAAHGSSILGDNDHCVAHIRELQCSIPIILMFPNTPEANAKARQESRALRVVLKPFQSSKGNYSNYNHEPGNSEEKAEMVKTSLSGTERILAIKAKVDPDNVFVRSVLL